MVDFIKKHKYQIILWIFIIAYILYFSFLTILRYRTLYASYFDLGIMNQTVYNTYKGIVTKDPSRILEMTDADSPNQIKRMAIHSDILLALLAPFYLIHPGPDTLLVIQSVVAAFGALFLFKIVQEILKKHKQKDFLALVFSFAYLLYPAAERENIFDFHAVTLATTLLLAMFYFWLKRRHKLSFLFFILSILTKEEVGLITALFGFYALFTAWKNNKHKKDVIYPLAIIIISIVWFVLTVFIITPYFRGGHHFAVTRYTDFGDSPIRIIIGVLKSPYSVFKYLVQPDSLLYFLFLLGPLGFISILSPIQLLISAPEFAINLLSNNSLMRSINFQYTAVITPFIFISAVFAAQKILNKYNKVKKIGWIFGCVLLGFSLIFAYFKGPLPYSREQDIHPLKYPQAEAKEVAFWANVLKDDNLKISTTGQLAPVFTSRRYFYIFSRYYGYADYVILRTKEVFEYPEKNDLIPVYKQLQRDRRYEIIYKNGELEVYKKI